MLCTTAHSHPGESNVLPDPAQFAARAEELPELIHSLQLIDHQSSSFRIADLKGRVILLNFMFTGCPDVCGLQTVQLQRLQKGLSTIDEEMRRWILSISINPATDLVL